MLSSYPVKFKTTDSDDFSTYSPIQLNYDEFSATTAYAKGDIVAYTGHLYKFIQAHPVGAWNAAQVVQIKNDAIWPSSWKESYETVENVNLSEAGTDIVNVTRYGKLSVSASLKCTRTVAKQLKGYSNEPYIYVALYDVVSAGYVKHKVRFRDFKISPINKSWELTENPYSDGIYEVSFSLKEI